ncbi:MAG: hypothetical protein DWQ47_11055 [Acidobacteria bacterium]|nr:MAG: hypothetical protein DWQ32_13470 [Acidobacteriota bacterium]REJ98117.1 MAG: hypothetical protein DWQ38_16270 [Acidobacteriota bacterium]REK16860.1 MAG: hypothetical protein DWQ43_01315 [Acidobacteriota bacterium]REK42771.1 MAG: hypothetical protein DWQ47_11055 [Acidobacteriota bacterium]
MYIAIRSKSDNSQALEAARGHSPNIEIVGPRMLIFDITGSAERKARRLAEEIFSEGAYKAIGVSDNAAAALMLARHREGVSFATAEDPKELEEIPVDALDADREFRELMDAWGIVTLGEFRELPEDDMVERFGLEIIPHREAASGTAYRAPGWNVRDNNFLWSRRLDGEIKTIEPLHFILSAGVRQVFENLSYTGLSTQTANIILSGRGGRKEYKVRLVFPVLNEKIWLRQIVSKVEQDPPEFGIECVEAEFESCRPRVVQNNLYSGAVLEPENLDLVVSKLKKVVGVKDIGVPRLRDSWSRPFSMTENLSPLTREFDEKAGEVVFAAYYRYPKPVRARIAFENGMPRVISIKGKRQMIRTAAGPWRADAEWHRADVFARDEWDVETESGAVYRVVVNGPGEGMIEGGFD